MSDLAAVRLADIHKQFLDAARRFPHLRFLAVRPHSEHIEWPRFPDGRGGATLGLPVGAWRALFGQLTPHSDYALKPLDEVWLSLDGGLWQGAFFYDGPDVPAKDLRLIDEEYRRAVKEFLRLGDLAANHFDVPSDPEFCGDSGELLRARRSHRWLERLCSLDIDEACEGCLVCVRRLKADLFTASARAVEALTNMAKVGSVRGTSPDPDGDSPAADADRELMLAQLRPAVRKAYFSYLAAVAEADHHLGDREAYDWIQDQGLPEAKGALGELGEYQLPAYETWCRQLRAAREHLGEQKNRPRAGRQYGSSIKSSREVEHRPTE